MKKLIKNFDCPFDKTEFNNANMQSNIKNASTTLYLVIAFEVLLTARMFFVYSRPFPDYIIKYLFCYAFLIVSSAVALIGIKISLYSKKNYSHSINILMTACIFCFLIWSIAITTLDSYNSERFIVYLTIVVCMTSVLKLRPWLFFTIEIGGFFMLNAALLVFNHRFNSSQVINLSVFTIIYVAISVSNYNSSVTDYYNKKKIRQLNETLESEKERYMVAAKTDQLTGLFSRNILMADMKSRISENYKTGRATGVAMLDLDDFKIVNDTYGHSIGDECLRKLGECFRNYPTLTVYRYGGEEFLAVCDGISELEFINTIDRIVKRVSEFELSVDSLRLTVSAGCIYCVPESETCYEKMINSADNALYEAKKSGKNKYVVGHI